MADHHGETIVVLELKDKRIELGEIEFLLYASFVIRCKKEVEWLDYKGIKNAGYIFSRDVSLVFIKVSEVITVVYRYKEYSLTRLEFTNYINYLYDRLDEYKHVEGLDYRTFDPVYLEFILAVDLPYLTGTCREKKYLRELKVFVGEGEGVAIEDSRHYNMIQSGNIPELEVTTNLSNQTYDESLL